LQIFAYILAIVALLFAIKYTSYSGRVVSGILTLYWLWTGIVFKKAFPSTRANCRFPDLLPGSDKSEVIGITCRGYLSLYLLKYFIPGSVITGDPFALCRNPINKDTKTVIIIGISTYRIKV
jgi:hypothetical protein